MSVSEWRGLKSFQFFSSTPSVAFVSLFTSDRVLLWPGSRYVAQDGFKLTAILLSQSPDAGIADIRRHSWLLFFF